MEIKITLIILFLIFSAFFSSSEAAFLSIQKTRLSFLVNSNVPGAERIANMVANTEKLLSTILLGNNLVNVALTAMITSLSVELMQTSSAISVIIAIAIGTGLLLIFGEIIPKSIAVKKAEKVTFLFARPLKLVEFCLYPIVIFLQWLSSNTQSLFGHENADDESVTEDEILSLIDIGEAEGTVEATEAEMVENIFRFSDKQTKEVMTPRTEIVSIEKGAGFKDFLQIYRKHSHTRFPVHKNSPEDIIGILSAKDILRIMASQEISENISINEVIRDAYFVPETKLAADLFEELRQTGNQMAICLDEYGGIAGLVTLKRLTEAIVGKVGEEGESLSEEYASITENIYKTEGGMYVDEANDEMNLNLPTGEYETIAGFALSQMGKIPRKGDRFVYQNLEFEISLMDELRIDSIIITKKDLQNIEQNNDVVDITNHEPKVD
jgi:putative hemolysin